MSVIPNNWAIFDVSTRCLTYAYEVSLLSVRARCLMVSCPTRVSHTLGPDAKLLERLCSSLRPQLFVCVNARGVYMI